MSEIEVKHYGVKGMRWGVRKDSPSGVKRLSDKELSTRLKRMRMEQEYSRLTASQNSTVVQRGARTVSTILGNAAKQAVTNLVAGRITSLLDDALP